MPSTDPDIRTAEGVQPKSEYRRFGAFAGVFTPTVLTILGVIMYLRTGWVVGNAGILGSLLIIALAFSITMLTALSMSSIITNMRIGAGGAYSIISQSLGLEVGGSVGIPLYLSQALVVTMYVFGFRDGWLWIFPDHSALLVDGTVFTLLFVIAYISANLAFKIQYLILAIIAGSLVSVGMAAATGSMQYEVTQVSLWGTYPGAPEDGFEGTDFWFVFAVLFPAATGIMAGANMSGELKDPKRSIPRGTLSAIGVSLVVYALLAYWAARTVPLEELVSNYYAMIDYAYWGPVVVAGLLGATFSSALACIVGAPRILQALGNHNILPASGWIAKRADNGEPRHAMVITGLIILISLLLRDLNAVAPLITMFFLITYATINLVVLVEQSLGLASFRPLFQVPRMAPLLGLIGCLAVMFIINVSFGIGAIVVVAGVYLLLVRSHLNPPFDDVRSGLLVSLAEWAAQKVEELPDKQERAWKPNLLVPVENTRSLRGSFLLLSDIARPKGTIKLLGLSTNSEADKLQLHLEDMSFAFRDNDVFTTWTVVEHVSPKNGIIASMQALRGSFFSPNIIFLDVPTLHDANGGIDDDTYSHIVSEADDKELGVIMHAREPEAGLGQRSWINVWIHDRSPDWQLSMDIGNLDLSMLVAYKLKTNWNARLRLITVVEDEGEVENAHNFLDTLTDLSRIPDAEVMVETGSFNEKVAEAPQVDLNIFGIIAEPDMDFVSRMVQETDATCLFVRDSGYESALA